MAVRVGTAEAMSGSPGCDPAPRFLVGEPEGVRPLAPSLLTLAAAALPAGVDRAFLAGACTGTATAASGALEALDDFTTDAMMGTGKAASLVPVTLPVLANCLDLDDAVVVALLFRFRDALGDCFAEPPPLLVLGVGAGAGAGSVASEHSASCSSASTSSCCTSLALGAIVGLALRLLDAERLALAFALLPRLLVAGGGCMADATTICDAPASGKDGALEVEGAEIEATTAEAGAKWSGLATRELDEEPGRELAAGTASAATVGVDPRCGEGGGLCWKGTAAAAGTVEEGTERDEEEGGECKGATLAEVCGSAEDASKEAAPFIIGTAASCLIVC